MMAGQLIERGDRKWLIRVFVGRGPDGKRKYFNKTIHGTKREAQRFLNEKVHQQDRGLLVVPSQRTVREYLIDWIDNGKPRISSATRDSYRWMLLQYVLPELGDRRLDQLGPFEIQQLYSRMSERRLSARTIRYAHAILRSALAQAVRWRMLHGNPADLVELPKMVRKEMRALGPREAAAFLEAARGDRWEPLWALLLVTGLRPGEALGLKWTDIDWDQQRIRIQRTLIRDDNHEWRFGEPKTDRSRRSVAVPRTAMRGLRVHRTGQAQERLKMGAGYAAELNLVFANGCGEPLDYSVVVRRHFKPIVKSAGLEPLRPYDLRHTCATLLLGSGEHPKVVAERLGHSSTVMTMDVYSHVLPDMQERAADKLESILFGTAGSLVSKWLKDHPTAPVRINTLVPRSVLRTPFPNPARKSTGRRIDVSVFVR
jgi:integrase